MGSSVYAQNPSKGALNPQVRELDNCLSKLTNTMKNLLEDASISVQTKKALLKELPQKGEVTSEMLQLYKMLDLKPDVLISAAAKATKRCEQLIVDPKLAYNLIKKGPSELIPELMGDPDDFFNVDSWDIIQKKA